MTSAVDPVRVGLVGAGYWAEEMHAPLHAAGAETILTGIWTPSGRGADLAAKHSVPLFRSYEELLDASEAVDFAVPPSVQAELGVTAAAAGKGLLLEKPLGVTLGEARRLADAIGEADVAHLVILTKRYHRRTRDFLDECRRLTAEAPASAVAARYLHGGLLQRGFLGTAQRASWRDGSGVLFDLGPHLLDLMDLAAGPIRAVRADRNDDAVLVQTRHEGGAVGTALLSARTAVPEVDTSVEVFGTAGSATYSTRGMDHAEVWPEVRREFAAAVRDRSPVTVDVHRALVVQELLDAAQRSLELGHDVELADRPRAIPSIA